MEKGTSTFELEKWVLAAHTYNTHDGRLKEHCFVRLRNDLVLDKNFSANLGALKQGRLMIHPFTVRFIVYYF